eukprot:TRINITY_DN2575_c0_g1_i1.p1 TRINITY_DN2575_c0_g1~~TRINITY_DN2575_c0_g1_i1.p1  ORF type:complete len:376 (+),score=79.42 TRINITY_DN2575_c0_g1_i1:119-1129(+)
MDYDICIGKFCANVQAMEHSSHFIEHSGHNIMKHYQNQIDKLDPLDKNPIEQVKGLYEEVAGQFENYVENYESTFFEYDWDQTLNFQDIYYNHKDEVEDWFNRLKDSDEIQGKMERRVRHLYEQNKQLIEKMVKHIFKNEADWSKAPDVENIFNTDISNSVPSQKFKKNLKKTLKESGIPSSLKEYQQLYFDKNSIDGSVNQVSKSLQRIGISVNVNASAGIDGTLSTGVHFSVENNDCVYGSASIELGITSSFGTSAGASVIFSLVPPDELDGPYYYYSIGIGVDGWSAGLTIFFNKNLKPTGIGFNGSFGGSEGVSYSTAFGSGYTVSWEIKEK